MHSRPEPALRPFYLQKDRKGSTLTYEDIQHYQKIVVALNKTIRLMSEIEAAIDKHDG